MSVDFRPLHDRVLVKRSESVAKSAGGIIIPDAAKETAQDGMVIAVGNGTRTDEGSYIALDVQVGDHVLFGKHTGTEITLDDTTYLILKESDILGVKE